MDSRIPEWTGPDFLRDRDASQLWAGAEPGTPVKDGYSAEFRTAAEMEDEVEAWRALAGRAVEPNVFAEPDLVLPGIQHLQDGRKVKLLLVWEGARSTAGGGALRAVFPLLMPRRSLVRRIKVWSPVSGAPGIPLVDRQAPAEVIEAALSFLASRFPRARLAFSQLVTGGAFAGTLRSAVARTGRPLSLPDSPGRHILVNGHNGTDTEATRRNLVDALGARRRRLAPLGVVGVDHARTARSVRDAVEELLTLDACAAGERGGALLRTPGSASFIRVATRKLAQDGRCRVDVLRAGGRAIAAVIIIESGHQAWVWRLVADPSLTHFSPAKLLMLDVTRTQFDQAELICTEAWDGCGDGLEAPWQTRTAADYVIAVSPRPSLATLPARIARSFMRLRLAWLQASPGLAQPRA